MRSSAKATLRWCPWTIYVSLGPTSLHSSPSEMNCADHRAIASDVSETTLWKLPAVRPRRRHGRVGPCGRWPFRAARGTMVAAALSPLVIFRRGLAATARASGLPRKSVRRRCASLRIYGKARQSALAGETPPTPLDAPIIFAPVGGLVPLARLTLHFWLGHILTRQSLRAWSNDRGRDYR